jgi:hypothetical protein
MSDQDNDTHIRVIHDAIEFPTAREAVAYAEPGVEQAISIDGSYLVVPRHEAKRLDAARVTFAYLHAVEYPPGSGNYRVVSVPVN